MIIVVIISLLGKERFIFKFEKIIMFSLVTKHYWLKNKKKRVLFGFNRKGKEK